MPEIRDNLGEEALRQATLAVALGRQWLQDSVDEREAEEERLGAELERLRDEPFEQSGRASKAFRRAAVFAWVIFVWQDRRSRISRLATQKATYLLEHGMDLQLFTEHRRKRFGPYDHTARYKDAEPIAVQQRWLYISGTVIRPGDAIGNVARYSRWYVRREDLARRLLQVIEGLSDAELETWATVHSAAQALSRLGIDVTSESIRALLERMPEWKEKITRNNFSESAIRSALHHLVRLRLLRL
jgi:hypothetical protein